LHAGFSPSNRAAAATAVAIVVGLTANVLRSDVWELVLAVPSGFLITWFGTLWLGLGLRNKILRDCSRFVLPGESLVIVQESEDRTADVIAVLRSIALPSVFVIRPALQLGSSSQFEETSPETVTMASLPDCAAELAASLVLQTAASLGVPVSTTHTITGSIVGVGTAKRLKAVKWAVGLKIIYAWVFTLPVTAILAAVLARLFLLIPK
jgi:hypothetical protein